MLLVDGILVLILLGFIGAGIKDGCISSLGRLIGSVVGFLAARAWVVPVGGALSVVLPSGIANIVACVIVFVGISQLVGFAFRLVDGVFKILSFIPFLNSINSILGAFIGAGEGTVIVGGCIYLIKQFVLEPHLVAWVTSSVVAQWIERGFALLFKMLL